MKHYFIIVVVTVPTLSFTMICSWICGDGVGGQRGSGMSCGSSCGSGHELSVRTKSTLTNIEGSSCPAESATITRKLETAMATAKSKKSTFHLLKHTISTAK